MRVGPIGAEGLAVILGAEVDDVGVTRGGGEGEERRERDEASHFAVVQKI